ncbi:MAG: DMT family transporter [Roseovarius sp.]|nr:DMT family transporter [Roseovarius sp.]
MVLTSVLFVAVTALVKILGTRVPAPQAAFLRYLMGLVFLLPVLWTLGHLRLGAGTWGLIGVRGVMHALGVALWFHAMTRIPIADVTAMNYLTPVYVTLGAALFLGERLAARRILAVIAALCGALIILRPGFREVGEGHLAMLVAAVVFGGSYLIAKVLLSRVSAGVLVAMLSLAVAIGLAPVAIAVWVPPTPRELAILLAVACVATAGHYTMALAFRAAPLAVTQPVNFLQLVWAVLLGALVFGEGVDVFVILGGALIVASISVIAWREAVLRRRIPPPVPGAGV